MKTLAPGAAGIPDQPCLTTRNTSLSKPDRILALYSFGSLRFSSAIFRTASLITLLDTVPFRLISRIGRYLVVGIPKYTERIVYCHQYSEQLATANVIAFKIDDHLRSTPASSHRRGKHLRLLCIESLNCWKPLSRKASARQGTIGSDRDKW